jgi:hypothetical protein
VLPYASPKADKGPRPPPFYSKPIPPDVLAVLSAAGLFVFTSILKNPLPAVSLVGCLGWFLLVRLDGQRHIRVSWRWAKGVAATWGVIWTFNTLRLSQVWPGWRDYVWVYNPPLQRSAYIAAAGVLIAVICEVAGLLDARQRRRQQHLKNAAQPGAPGDSLAALPDLPTAP